MMYDGVDFSYTRNQVKKSLDITNLNELSEILKQDESMAMWLKNSACAINDLLTNDKNSPLKDGDTVTLLPPVCGG